MIRKILGSEFMRNVLKLISGTTLAQAIPFLILPIITRYYTPEDFTVLENFMVFVEILVVTATFKYEFAIMQPKRDEDAIQLVFLVLLLSTVVSTTYFLVGFFFGDYLSAYVPIPGFKDFAPWIGIGVYLYALHLAFNYWFSRKKKYGMLATTKVVETSTAEGTKLAWGIFKISNYGLVIGFITGRIFMGLYYLVNFIRSPLVRSTSIDRKRINELAGEYNKYPRFTFWSSLIGRSTAWGHIFLFTIYFGPIVGFIALARRLLFAPLNIISNSYSQVFYQRVSEIDDGKTLMKVYVDSLKPLAVIALSVVIAVLALPDGTIDLILGGKWKGTQPYVEILVFWFVINFVSTSVSFIHLHLGKQKQMLYLDIIHATMAFGAIFIGIGLDFSGLNTLRLFTASQALFYIGMILLGWYFIKQRIKAQNSTQ